MQKPAVINRVPDDVAAKYNEERAKRLRSDGIAQYREVVGDLRHFVDDPFVDPEYRRDPVTKEVDIVLIGAGFASLVAGARLREAGFEDICVIEKAGDVGGTWYWNRYPGAACDVESLVYLPLLEELAYVPELRYSFAPEIRAHAEAIARHYRLYEGALFQTGVTRLEWLDAQQLWLVETDQGDTIRAKYVSMAQGPMSRPKLPGVPGIETFKGMSFHTSRWNYDYTGGDETGDMVGLSDKRVGIIGTGATAIQCIPHLGAAARELFVFQRTPSAVDFRNNAKVDPATVAAFAPGWQDERMRNFETLVSGGSAEIDLVSDNWTAVFQKLTSAAVKRESDRLGRKLTPEERQALLESGDFEVMDLIRKRIDDVVQDPDTAERLKPWYKRWCKRPAFHDGYLETFNRPNVTLVDTDGRGVDRVTETSVFVDGREYEVDCLIFATGFEVGNNYTQRAEYDVVGRNGVKLSNKWAKGHRTFHGLFSRDFPNMFFLGQTQTGLTINYPHALSEQARHVAHVLSHAMQREAATIEATEEAEQEWVDEIARLARRGAVYYRDCTPSYMTNEGNLKSQHETGLLAGAYGKGAISFFDLLRDWREQGTFKGLEFR